MSEFNLLPGNSNGNAVDPFSAEPRGVWTLNHEEAATIWYALDAYKKSILEQTGNNASVEDQAFLYEIVARTSKLQFELRDNHESVNTARMVREWLNTD